MDVGGWLRRLGLEQYEASFRENKIDDTVLPRLTAEDLKDLGVGFVGDRRKLLDAIAAVRAEASAPTPPLSDAPLATDKAAQDTAERRQVTVMFSDLVGSTALSARMDPEDLREVISAYQKCVAEAVRRCGGYVAKYMGDVKLQVALITPLIHVKGYAAPETKAAAEQARLLIEQAEALGEPPEDPLLLFSVLYAFWVAHLVAFNGDVCRDLAAQFLALAEKQRATVPLMVEHRIMGTSLLLTGDIVGGRGHLDRAIGLYDPAEHRPLATRFGQDVGVSALTFRTLALWLLGYAAD